MKLHKIGVIMNGVTGRMGTNQHLIRSLAAIISQGGVKVSDNEIIMPDLVLVGRNENKLKKLAERTQVERWTTNLDEVLKEDQYHIYFDAQTTGRRADAIKKAVAAGKHIYCEKPIATSTQVALELYQLCEKASLKHGVVQDKLWLPGMLKLKRLIENDFFGDILSVRGDFGYWVFEGHRFQPKDPVGITESRTMGGSLSICFVIGGMYWIIFLVQLKVFFVWGLHISQSVLTKMENPRLYC